MLQMDFVLTVEGGGLFKLQKADTSTSSSERKKAIHIILLTKLVKGIVKVVARNFLQESEPFQRKTAFCERFEEYRTVATIFLLALFTKNVYKSLPCLECLGKASVC